MTAAASPPAEAPRGAPRLLEHCAMLERLAGGEPGSARARLELELGGELTRFLCRALAGRPARRNSALWL